MKCPKCNYLGFETGDRCKNCGYDFSLIDLSPPSDVDIDLNLDPPATPHAPLTTPEWADAVDRALGAIAVTPAPPEPLLEPELESPAAVAPALQALQAPLAPEALQAPQALPLYHEDDEPLIKLPATPRAPLAVRKTPDIPRLRAVPKPARAAAAEPALQFAEVPEETPEPIEEPAPMPAADFGDAEPGTWSARLGAAGIDHLILAGIDVAVVYLTLRMAQIDGWALLPLAPLATFLVLLKVAYFCAFTAIGGQTIGKMAMGIRVVTDEGGPVDGACAIRRTLAGTVSTVVLGLGFLPALIGPGGRAMHDHLARTRVVDLHSA
jgi:uncharacterized RDD family membrane protein YckC